MQDIAITLCLQVCCIHHGCCVWYEAKDGKDLKY